MKKAYMYKDLGNGVGIGYYKNEVNIDDLKKEIAKIKIEKCKEQGLWNLKSERECFTESSSFFQDKQTRHQIRKSYPGIFFSTSSGERFYITDPESLPDACFNSDSEEDSAPSTTIGNNK